MIPVGFGVQKVAGTMIWATDIDEEKHTRKEGDGLFGWRPGDRRVPLFRQLRGRVRRGPGRRGAADLGGREADLRPPRSRCGYARGLGATSASLFTGNSKYRFRIYLGTEDQEPDRLIVRKVLEETGEAEAVPAHRGLVYIVFDRLPLAEWNNRIPPITAEIAWSGARPATVRNATFLPHDGGTSFQRPGIAVDFARGYIYLEGNGGMHRIRTSDMQEDLHVGADYQPGAGGFESQHL